MSQSLAKEPSSQESLKQAPVGSNPTDVSHSSWPMVMIPFVASYVPRVTTGTRKMVLAEKCNLC